MSLNALIRDNSRWEMIYKGKSSCIKYFKNMHGMVPNKCNKFYLIQSRVSMKFENENFASRVWLAETQAMDVSSVLLLLMPWC